MSPAPRSPGAVAWRFWQAAGDGDVEGALALLDPAGVWRSRAIGEVPMPAITAFLRSALEHVPIRFTLRALHGASDGDTVALELEGHGQVADGTPYDNHYCFVMAVRDGRIVEVREYTDTLYAREVLLANLPGDVVRDLMRAGRS